MALTAAVVVVQKLDCDRDRKDSRVGRDRRAAQHMAAEHKDHKARRRVVARTVNPNRKVQMVLVQRAQVDRVH